MKWKMDRDLLIAQTLAFVQSVTGKTTEDEGKVEPIPLDEPAKAERPVEAVAVARPPPAPGVVRPTPVPHGDFREEIRGRMAAFRAHQELFNRDRDEYCNSILAKARSTAERPSKAPDDHPIKR